MKKPKSSAPFVFEVYQDSGGQWRWRLWAKNGKIVADSAEGYVRQSQAIRMCERLIDNLLAAAVRVVR